MAIEVLLPKLGVTMDEGTILKWHKKEGDTVVIGDLLFEIETDKATLEVESEVEGTLLKIILHEGQGAPVASTVAVVGAPGEDISRFLPVDKKNETIVADSNIPLKSPLPKSGEEPGGKIIATPRAKKLAMEKHIELSLVKGSGENGRISEEDVLNYVKQSSKALKYKEKKYDGIRRTIGERLLGSYLEKPHIYLTVEADMKKITLQREKVRSTGIKPPSIADYVMYACAAALKKYPEANSTLVGDTIIESENINIGYAVDTPKGLFVPVVKNTAKMSVKEIAEHRSLLVQKALNGALLPDEMRDGTFTISSLGNFGVKEFTAIINPPQIAILAVGAMEKRILVLDDESIVIRPCMNMTISVDHRVLDGAFAAKVLNVIKEYLENPTENEA